MFKGANDWKQFSVRHLIFFHLFLALSSFLSSLHRQKGGRKRRRKFAISEHSPPNRDTRRVVGVCTQRNDSGFIDSWHVNYYSFLLPPPPAIISSQTILFWKQRSSLPPPFTLSTTKKARIWWRPFFFQLADWSIGRQSYTGLPWCIARKSMRTHVCLIQHSLPFCFAFL